MNRYFFPGEGREAYPQHSFAKLDQIEPPNHDEARDVTLAFDAIDAKWSGFESGQLLSLEPDPKAELQRGAYWRQRFGPPGERDLDGPDPFDDLPMYRIEITLARNNPCAEELIATEGRWMLIELNDEQGIEVDVFGGLFMPAVPARMARRPSVAMEDPMLARLFGMDDWPDATAVELDDALRERCPTEHLLVFDVGQGSATALACPCGHILYYFDVGCGVYRNARTRPARVTFCTHAAPRVILSHWDADHWAGAALDRDLLRMTWVAPRQSISHKHQALGNDILRAGGSLLIVPPALSPVSWGGYGQRFALHRCTGRDRNGSGLALIVEDGQSQRGWLLTGDAGYQHIPGQLPLDLAAVVVPHHGADMGAQSKPPQRSAHPYSRLVYSFGPGNAHGRTAVRHPTAAAVAAHSGAAWSHGSWSSPQPGMVPAGPPVLATASHLQTHEHGIAIGWTSPARLASHGHAASCSRIMPIKQS